MLQALKDYSAGISATSRKDICNLYAITHSPVGMKKEWKRFIKDLGIPSRFLNRNEFSMEFGQSQTTFPIVLVRKGTELQVLIGTEDLNRCKDVNDLIFLMMQHL